MALGVSTSKASGLRTCVPEREPREVVGVSVEAVAVAHSREGDGDAIVLRSCFCTVRLAVVVEQSSAASRKAPIPPAPAYTGDPCPVPEEDPSRPVSSACVAAHHVATKAHPSTEPASGRNATETKIASYRRRDATWTGHRELSGYLIDFYPTSPRAPKDKGAVSLGAPFLTVVPVERPEAAVNRRDSRDCALRRKVGGGGHGGPLVGGGGPSRLRCGRNAEKREGCCEKSLAEHRGTGVLSADRQAQCVARARAPVDSAVLVETDASATVARRPGDSEQQSRNRSEHSRSHNLGLRG